MVTVVIPVLNEAKTIDSVIRFAFSQADVTEVIVVDDGSVDDTPAIASRAGATVITSTLLGKGASLADGLGLARNEIVVFLDGDLEGLVPDLVARLIEPIQDNKASFVKAKFSRASGRVTTLTAKPLLRVFFPELARFEQPLGGIVAARKSTLSKISLETDYGVDLGMLIDLHMLGESIAEVDIGALQHDSQPLQDLSSMANQVIRTLFHRAAKYNRFQIQQLMEVEEWERRTDSHLANFPGLKGESEAIALFDMDGTLVRGRFIVNLAVETGRTNLLFKFLDNTELHPVERTRLIARIFENIPMETFVNVARKMPLFDGVIETIRELRRLGFRVGIVSDSFRVAAETIRRRVFADFSLAHVMRFNHGIATGEVGICPSMFHQHGCESHLICKMNALLHISETTGIPLENFIAIGDGENDMCMLQTVGQSFAFHPKADRVRQAASDVIDGEFSDILKKLSLKFQSIALPISCESVSEKQSA